MFLAQHSPVGDDIDSSPGSIFAQIHAALLFSKLEGTVLFSLLCCHFPESAQHSEARCRAEITNNCGVNGCP